MFDAIAHNSNYFTASHAQEQSGRTVAANAEDLKDVKHAEATQKTRSLSGQEEVHPDGRPKDSVEISKAAQEIRELKGRDREVRAHEAAHASTGGSYAGAPSYTFERGADGQSYAVGGEVSIDVSPVAGDPAATIQKAQQVRAAALAPAQPSGQDMKVAQTAQALAAKARVELAAQEPEQAEGMSGHAPVSSTQAGGTGQSDSDSGSAVDEAAGTASSVSGARASLSSYV